MVSGEGRPRTRHAIPPALIPNEQLKKTIFQQKSASSVLPAKITVSTISSLLLLFRSRAYVLDERVFWLARMVRSAAVSAVVATAESLVVKEVIQ